MWCWKDGEYMHDYDLTISPFDHGFLYGVGFFETFRTYNGQPFLFDEHMERLQQALDEYKIQLPYSTMELRNVIDELTRKSNNKEGYFRLNVSAGNEGLGLQASIYLNPTVIIFRKELIDGPIEKTATWLNTRRNTPEQSTRYKSHYYANNILARQEMTSLKEQEGIFETAEGYVAEGITSNVFWVKSDVLYTPSLETGILNGITRQFLLRLAEELHIPFIEGKFTRLDVMEADECFVTTSIQEIIPIRQIEQRIFSGLEGKVYQKLHNRYKEYRGDGLK